MLARIVTRLTLKTASAGVAKGNIGCLFAHQSDIVVSNVATVTFEDHTQPKLRICVVYNIYRAHLYCRHQVGTARRRDA